MLIDGFTVAAQIINFLVLIFLLRRFLYGPITRVMQEREAKIAAQLAEAENLKQVALHETETFRQEREALQNQRERLIVEAREEAEALRRELVKKAREEIDDARASWHKTVEAEKHAFLQEVRQRIGRLVYTISRRALADLADADLEQRMIAVLTRRLQGLDEPERKIMAESIRKSGHKVIVRTAFEVQDETRQKLLQVLRRDFSDEVYLQSELSPDLLCGIEVIVQDHKLAWTCDDYLASLETSLFDTLEGEIVHAAG